MARVEKNGNFSGTIDNVVYRNYNGTIVACQKPTTYRDAKTEGQVVYRVKMRNIQNIYAALKEALRGNFQDKVGRQTDYSRFQGVNMQKPAVYLSKNEVAMKAQVVAPYIVSFGTLPQVEYELKYNSLVTNISLGNLSITPDTTVSEIVLAIVKNNDGWEYDDCLEFMAVKQSEGKTPTAKCCFAHLSLDKNDTSKLSDALIVRNASQIELGSSEEGFLQMNVSDNAGFAIIRKRMASKGLMTSTQELAINNPLFDQYHSEKSKQKAMDSYGVNRNKSFLVP
jgi:hypothetical protein